MDARKQLKIEICQYFESAGAGREKLPAILEGIKWVAGGTMKETDVEERAAMKFSEFHQAAVIDFALKLIAIEQEENRLASRKDSSARDIALARATLADPTSSRADIQWASEVLR